MINTVDLELVRQQINCPTGEARGVPNSFYNDAESFIYERERLFAKTWACVGFVSDVSNPGDAKPFDFMGLPLFLMHTNEGEIKVFHNVCSHRGMRLLDEEKNFPGTIRCPYHAWCYNHDGELRVTPHIAGVGKNKSATLDQSQHGLKEVACGVLFGVVFINLDGQAGRFTDFCAPLREAWGEYFNHPLYSTDDSEARYEVNANWKLAIENYCESYHLPWIHPGLNSYSKLEDHYNIVTEGHYSGQGSFVYRPILSKDNQSFPVLEGLSQKWATGAEYVSFFPNVLLGVHRDHIIAVQLDPKSHRKTSERLQISYFHPAVKEKKYEKLRQQNLKIWSEVFNEDVFVVEGMQRGRDSTAFQGGVFSEAMDPPTHCFHRWVVNQYTGHTS